MNSSNCCARGEPDPVKGWPQVYNMTAMDKLLSAGRMVLSPNSDISLDPSVQTCMEPVDIAIAWLQRQTESYKRDMELLERFRIPPPDHEDDKHPPTLPVRMRGRVGVREYELQDKEHQRDLAKRLKVRRERRGARKRKIVHERRMTLRNQKRRRRRIARDESGDREGRGRKKKAEDARSMTSTMIPHPKRCMISNEDFGLEIGTARPTQTSPQISSSKLSNEADPSLNEPATNNEEMSMRENLPRDYQLPSTSRQQLISVPTIGDGRCFFRAVTICQDRNLQHAERYVDGTPKDLHLKTEETIAADVLRSKTVGHMLENFSRYDNLDGRLVSADLPSTVSYSSMEDRISSMGKSTEMVGELEVAAMADYLRRPVHVFVGSSVLKFGIEYQEANPIEVKYSTLIEDVGHYEALVTRTVLENDEADVCEKPTTPSLFSLVTNPAVKTRPTNSDVVTSRPYQIDPMVENVQHNGGSNSEDAGALMTATEPKTIESEPSLFSLVTNPAVKTRPTNSDFVTARPYQIDPMVNDNVQNNGGALMTATEPETIESEPSLFSLVTRPDAFRRFSSNIVTSNPHTNHAMTKEGIPNKSESEATVDIPNKSESESTVDIPNKSESEATVDIPNKSESEARVDGASEEGNLRRRKTAGSV